MKITLINIGRTALYVLSTALFVLSGHGVYTGDYPGALFFLACSAVVFPDVATFIFNFVFGERKKNVNVINSLHPSGKRAPFKVERRPAVKKTKAKKQAKKK